MIHTSHSSFEAKQVLLCLANPQAVAGLNALLTDSGIAVTSTYTFNEFEDAIATVSFDAIVTNTARIKQVRTTSQVPIVNVEAFIFTTPHAAENSHASRSFDGDAFLARIIATVNHSYRRLGQQPKPTATTGDVRTG
ncbi:hypothetical protein [Rhizobium tubonense]|uniref:Uncharacterized protein n=1 Tax=Rhizobium tubonense TaxID=484088 RepID=A0A2W4ERX6_9HYPH|nr:hypothetical protein [Rhizobium tubonense]PZM13773.1 hypothetical protein CPY51_12930 [Rhizobium tubonense]